jgi:hypothetical protein
VASNDETLAVFRVSVLVDGSLSGESSVLLPREGLAIGPMSCVLVIEKTTGYIVTSM